MWLCEFLANGSIHRVSFWDRHSAEAFQNMISEIFGVTSVVHREVSQ